MSAASKNPWQAEGLDLVRGMSGGLLFGVPLLYTMEVWWTGSLSPSWASLLILILLFVPVLVMNKSAGFRSASDVRWRDAAADTVEAVALALLIAACTLVLIREVTLDLPLGAALGKIFYEAVPFALGIGMARHLLGGGRSETEGGDEEDDESSGDGGGDGQAGDGESAASGDEKTGTEGRSKTNPTLADLGATIVGAAFIALSIAPTDEVPMISSAVSPPWLVALMAASLLVSYAIVFVAGFAKQEQRHGTEGLIQGPLTETVVCYLVALAVSLALLAAFQRAQLPWPELLSQSIVLGFPAAVGGAAGRLAV